MRIDNARGTYARGEGDSSRQISGRPDELFGGVLALWAARSETPLQEVALHHIACERKGLAEVIAGNAVVPAPTLKLAQRRGVKRVAGKTIAVCNGVYLFEPTLRAVALRDCDRAVERDNWGRTYADQHVVEG